MQHKPIIMSEWQSQWQNFSLYWQNFLLHDSVHLCHCYKQLLWSCFAHIKTVNVFHFSLETKFPESISDNF